MDDDETTSGSIASDGHDSYNIPKGIFHHQHNGRHWVLNMYDDDTTSVIITPDGYDSYNVPEGIFRNQHNGRHWVHKIDCRLKTPLKSGTLTK